MAIKVIYWDKSEATEYEIGDLIQIKEGIKDLSGIDRSNTTGKVINTDKKFPIATLEIQVTSFDTDFFQSFETFQYHCILLSGYMTERYIER